MKKKVMKRREKRRNRADGSVTKKGRHAQSHVGPLNVAGCGRKRRVRIRGDRLGLLRALKQIRKYYLPKTTHGAMWTVEQRRREAALALQSPNPTGPGL